MNTYQQTEKFKTLPWRSPGVYSISATIELEEWGICPIYIGSARNVKNRITSHFAALRGDRHCNTVIQNYYNKYGEQSFVVDILEVCDTDETLIKEQYWLDKVQPYADKKQGFNLVYCAEASRRGDKWSEATRQKHIIARSRPEYLKRRKEIYDGFKRTFFLISPSGERVTITGLRRFCRDNNLSPQDISKLKNGKIPSIKGWRLNPKPEFYKLAERFVLINPNGERINGCNITKFAKDHNLDYTLFRHVIRGYRKEYRGWKRA